MIHIPMILALKVGLTVYRNRASIAEGLRALQAKPGSIKPPGTASAKTPD